MKEVFMSVIHRGGYSLPVLLKNIDKYHVEGKISDADRDELYKAARADANPDDSVDVMDKLRELENRVAALESGKTAAPAGAEEYVAGKWYHTGDKCVFNGQTFVCKAPVNTVCVWSPSEYPAYWEVV